MNIIDLVKKLDDVKKELIQEISELYNFSGECDCEDSEPYDTIYDGEWKEIHTLCLNCGGLCSSRD